jgi:HEAT repeat protein
MREGLAITLAFLGQTDNEAAAGVLIPALDSPVPEVRQGALQALLARPHRPGHRAVIARLHTASAEERSLIEENHVRMTTALREAILSSDPQMCINGCQAAVRFRLFDVTATLVTALEEASGRRAAILGRTLLDLVDQLCSDVSASRQPDPRGDRRAPHEHITGALEVSAGRFGRHHRREIIEALTLLADCGNDTLKQILEDPLHPAFVVLMEVLSKSTRRLVLRFVLSYLNQPKAPSAALSVVGKRTDPEFVGLLLRQIARETSPVLLQNLKRMGAVAWANDGVLLEHLDGASQRAAVRLVMLSGTSRANAFEAVRHLLLRGELEGRRAAAEALKQFQGAEANALTLAALDDEDPEVQAEALVQLRGRGIAEARVRVVAMLDSPHASVRGAARLSLAEFTFPRFLATYDALDAATRQSTGQIVKKVDPHIVPLLEAEITSRGRTRRLRALAIARTLDLVELVEGSIMQLLKDEDHTVRADAADALAALNPEPSEELSR